jgi:hypothetical protein
MAGYRKQATSVVLIFLLSFPVVSKEEKYRCVRWAWTGDVYNRKVVCLEWKRVER